VKVIILCRDPLTDGRFRCKEFQGGNVDTKDVDAQFEIRLNWALDALSSCLMNFRTHSCNENEFHLISVTDTALKCMDFVGKSYHFPSVLEILRKQGFDTFIVTVSFVLLILLIIYEQIWSWFCYYTYLEHEYRNKLKGDPNNWWRHRSLLK